MEKLLASLKQSALDITAEDVTNKGRIDLTVKMDKCIYIIEFKVDGENKALTQLKSRQYHEKYLLNAGKIIYLIGIDFDSQKKTVTGFEWETVV
ncbi:MAG: PD-(D/E)XK nuclease domain-containing protein [Pseudomonadota bacterium]|nr:PD-(D/E)XK nuclease domain-containing protein [Pseudomonadota bacterium]